MTVKNLYDLMEKRRDDYTHWDFTIYVDGISNNILAYANSHYDIEGINKTDDVYSVKELFEHEVVSFKPVCEGIHVKIDKFPGMKYKKLESYIDENGNKKYRDVVKTWEA